MPAVLIPRLPSSALITEARSFRISSREEEEEDGEVEDGEEERRRAVKGKGGGQREWERVWGLKAGKGAQDREEEEGARGRKAWATVERRERRRRFLKRRQAGEDSSDATIRRPGEGGVPVDGQGGRGGEEV